MLFRSCRHILDNLSEAVYKPTVILNADNLIQLRASNGGVKDENLALNEVPPTASLAGSPVGGCVFNKQSKAQCPKCKTRTWFKVVNGFFGCDTCGFSQSYQTEIPDSNKRALADLKRRRSLPCGKPKTDMAALMAKIGRAHV